MKIKMWMAVLLAALCLCAGAAAETAYNQLQVDTKPQAFAYHFASEAETFLLLEYKNDWESGKITLYAEDGVFAGEVALPCTFEDAELTVSISELDGTRLARVKTVCVETPLPEAPQANLPETERAASKPKDLVITPEDGGFSYSFTLSGHDRAYIHYASSQQSGWALIYPGDDYFYEGKIDLEHTYMESYVSVEICNHRQRALKEIELRTAVVAPEAPAAQAGRLSGVKVCIDPGHQSNHVIVTEPLGPGLRGEKKSVIGMAQGTFTRRMESITVLEIGFLLRDVLLAQGAEVMMIRESQDTKIANMTRAEMANEWGADICLRLHCNNRSEDSVRGIRIYAPKDSDYAAALADQDTYRLWSELLLNAMMEATGAPKGGAELTNTYTGNNWMKMPNFLVEMGYMSNRVDDLLMAAPVYQRWLCEGMADGIYAVCQARGLVK